MLETIALGIIALDSDNDAGYYNADYDDARETFGERLKRSQIRICVHYWEKQNLNNVAKNCTRNNCMP